MNCPYCKKYFAKKQLALDHIEKVHPKQLDADHYTPGQALYFYSHGTLLGKCMACGNDTDWNYHTNLPHKICNDPECRNRLSKKAKENMVKVYGKETLLDDMEHQKAMQKHRPTAGVYKFSDGGEIGYLSKPELAFLKFCDTIMEFESRMVQESPETFAYYDSKADRNRQYIPDFYLPDYNLLVEIKDGGKHTNTNPAFIEETKYKVAMKDNVMKNQNKYNFIKIVDNNFGPFVELLYQITHNGTEGYTKPNKTLVVITENACNVLTDREFNIYDEQCDSLLLVRSIDKLTEDVSAIGITDSRYLSRIYASTMDENSIFETDTSNDLFDESTHYLEVYKCVADNTNMKALMNSLVEAVNGNNTTNVIQYMNNSNIWFTNEYMSFIKL